MFQIEYNKYRSIKPFNRRVRFLVMHYTACNFADSIKTLSGDGNVSAHYLIPDPKDSTYVKAGFKDLRIFNLVDENDRAWHAGVSEWAGRTNLNDSSIGIENVNLASDKEGVFTFPPYNPQQVKAIIQLSLNIIQRYPDITPTNVVGHSDIAFTRKSDPGREFPWKKLYDAGIGAWYDKTTQQKYMTQFSEALPSKNDVINKLKQYGYGTSSAQSEAGYKNLLRAFQLHFRPSNYDGVLDCETAAILYALVEKYFPV